MPAEIPLELNHIRDRLRADFTGKIPEAQSGTPDEKEANFLSRALAAFTLHKLAAASLEDASSAIVDGGGDGGIDAIYYCDNKHILWIVQSKFHQSGQGEPDLGSVTKFKTGLENLLSGRFEAFESNAAWKMLIPSLKIALADGSLKVRPVLVYTGLHLVSEDRRRAFEDLQVRFSPDSDYLEILFCNLKTIHDWIRTISPGIAELNFTLLKPGWVRDPYETVFGLLPLSDLAQIYKDHGKRLISANIRGYKGDTEVNEQIADTVGKEPENFFYLNNGLTAYCERLVVNNVDRADSEKKRIQTFGISIVNGAQTMGSIASHQFTPTSVKSGPCFHKDHFTRTLRRSQFCKANYPQH